MDAESRVSYHHYFMTVSNCDEVSLETSRSLVFHPQLEGKELVSSLVVTSVLLGCISRFCLPAVSSSQLGLLAALLRSDSMVTTS
jgi:hypothetical protein